MMYEDIQRELHDLQAKVDALEGLKFSLDCLTKAMREQVARIELGVQRTIDTQDDLK